MRENLGRGCHMTGMSKEVDFLLFHKMRLVRVFPTLANVGEEAERDLH